MNFYVSSWLLSATRLLQSIKPPLGFCPPTIERYSWIGGSKSTLDSNTKAGTYSQKPFSWCVNVGAEGLSNDLYNHWLSDVVLALNLSGLLQSFSDPLSQNVGGIHFPFNYLHRRGHIVYMVWAIFHQATQPCAFCSKTLQFQTFCTRATLWLPGPVHIFTMHHTNGGMKLRSIINFSYSSIQIPVPNA